MLLFHMLWITIYCDVPSSHRYHLRMTLYSQLLWNIPDDIISLCKKYQMLVIVWRLGVESLSDCHTFRFRTWLLAKTPHIYIYLLIQSLFPSYKSYFPYLSFSLDCIVCSLTQRYAKLVPWNIIPVFSNHPFLISQVSPTRKCMLLLP